MNSHQMKNTPLFVAIVLVGLALIAFFSSAQKGWTRSNMMEKTETEFLSSANLHEANFAESLLEDVLNDSRGRISAEFKVPPALREVVGFWLKIYTQFSSRQMVIFDEKHPELIYEVIDLRELQKRSQNAVVYEIMAKRFVKQRVQQYRAAFRRLSTIHPPISPRPQNSAEARILDVLKRSTHVHGLNEYAKNLRVQTGQRDNVIQGIAAAEPYLPKIEKIFDTVGIPKELTRLSLVESSFNLNAVSRVGASGVWQFMPKSAVEYMYVDQHFHLIDERLSPLKSSVAAARLLKRNFQSLENWALAVTAYNHGVRGVFRFDPEERAKASDGEIFLGCSPNKARSPLGFASRNYYAEFLAMLHAESYRDSFYGESRFEVLAPVRFELIRHAQPVEHFIRSRGMSAEQFRLLNPDVRSLRAVLPQGYHAAVPSSEEDVSGVVKKLSRSRSR